ncbi:MAG: type II secretion system secretin GspD, partial [Candidatus Aureabacteria bacterium]|nr:type II secretion system secretin GspD [Candidatus Auribacterota bacterium]
MRPMVAITRFPAALGICVLASAGMLVAQDDPAGGPSSPGRTGPVAPSFTPSSYRRSRSGSLPARRRELQRGALQVTPSGPVPQPSPAPAPQPSSTPVSQPPVPFITPEAAPGAAPSPTTGETGEGEEGQELVSLDLENVDIKYVIKLISEITGKNYILSEGVRGTVTVMSPTKIPVDALPRVLESLLDVRGLATVPSGELIKIVPRRDAVKSPIEFADEEMIEERSPDDTLVTQIVTLQYADLNEVQRLVQTLAGPSASVIPYPPTNMLIISDAISNLDRLMKIMNEVDIPALESTITVAPCKYAAASVLAEEILAIIQGKGGGARPAAAPRRRTVGRTAPPPAAAGGDEAIKLFADERTNALIIVASPEDTERVLALVEELDRAAPESSTRVKVRRLSYANSDDVASVLQSITSARTGEGMPQITVTSYPEINAVIIDAAPQDYDLLIHIIDDLDIPRDQVMVEVIVTEVDLGKSLSAEFQAQTLKGLDFTPDKSGQKGWNNIQKWGGSQFDPSLRQLIIDDLDKGYPLSAGAGANLGFVFAPESTENFIGPFSVLLNALEADTDINVLSAPQVLTSDNEEVSLEVADRVPILTSTLTTGAGTTGTDTIQQIDYRDVGVKLKIIPHISKDRFVRLEVDQSIEQLVGVSLADITGPLTPATLKRATSTVINVKDGHTVVISGMISDSYTTQETKVPILGDIPVIGLLARYRKNS